MAELFENLSEFPPSLSDAELRMLASLPEWPTRQEVFDEYEQRLVRRLERRGLVKVSRTLCDPAGTYREWWAGKLPAAGLREIANRPADHGKETR